MFAPWILTGGLFYALELSAGSFPKPLSPEEEQHYLKLSAAGDLQARNVLIERNLRLVAHIMKKYYAHASDGEDLISIGTVGLIKGVTTFNPSNGARLATYAARCVENSIVTLRKQRYTQMARFFSENTSVRSTGSLPYFSGAGKWKTDSPDSGTSAPDKAGIYRKQGPMPTY